MTAGFWFEGCLINYKPCFREWEKDEMPKYPKETFSLPG
jgi:hypothetical protein